MADMDEAVLKRVLPHSIEAEQSVIGAMLMDRKQYGILFDTMVELNDEGKPVDLITLQDRLKEKAVPPEIYSLEYIRDIMDTVPTSANIKYYANIVAEKSVLRKLIKVNEEIANNCYSQKETLEVLLEETEKKVFDIAQKRNNGRNECNEHD